MITLVCVNEAAVPNPNERAFYAAEVTASSTLGVMENQNAYRPRLNIWAPQGKDLTACSLCKVVGVNSPEAMKTILSRARQNEYRIYYSYRDHNGNKKGVDNIAAFAIPLLADEEEQMLTTS